MFPTSGALVAAIRNFYFFRDKYEQKFAHIYLTWVLANKDTREIM